MEIIAVADYNSVVKVWDIASGDITASLPCQNRMCLNSLSVCFSPCGTLLAACGNSHSVVIWDCASWTKAVSLRGHTRPVTSVSFTRAGDKLVSTSSFENSIRVWCMETHTEMLKVETSMSGFSAIFDNTGDMIVVAIDRWVIKYDATSGASKQTFSGHTETIHSLDLSRDGEMLISGSHDYTCIIWDFVSGEAIRVLRGHTHGISQVRFNADASRIVSSSWDNTARVWDVSTGECLLNLVGHEKYVYCCSFSEDGSKVVTGSQDQSIKVWDSCTGEELKTLTGHNSSVYSISCRPAVFGSFI